MPVFERGHIASTLLGEVRAEQTDVGDQQNAVIADGDRAAEACKTRLKTDRMMLVPTWMIATFSRCANVVVVVTLL